MNWLVGLGSTLILALPAQGAFQVPALTGPVVDLAQVIDSADEQWLEEQIRSLQQAGVAQLQVLTVPDLGGDVIEQASIRVADQWKLGTDKQDNGILVLFSQGDRQVRIEVGQGLEGTVPDIVAGRIIRNVMIPRFQNNQFSAGVVDGVSHLIDILRGQPSAERLTQANPQSSSRPSTGKGQNFFFVFFIFMFLLMRMLGRLGSRRNRSFWGSSVGWGSGGGFGSGGFGGGGGGWSGGGGGFSGGGSSGRW